jgi:hypothetical protein
MTSLSSAASGMGFSIAPEDFESRFASRFHPVHQFPPPDHFTGCQKIYPTRQRMQP